MGVHVHRSSYGNGHLDHDGYQPVVSIYWLSASATWLIKSKGDLQQSPPAASWAQHVPSYPAPGTQPRAPFFGPAASGTWVCACTNVWGCKRVSICVCKHARMYLLVHLAPGPHAAFFPSCKNNHWWVSSPTRYTHSHTHTHARARGGGRGSPKPATRPPLDAGVRGAAWLPHTQSPADPGSACMMILAVQRAGRAALLSSAHSLLLGDARVCKHAHTHMPGCLCGR